MIMKTTTVLTGKKEAYGNIREMLDELLGWRLEAIQEEITKRNLDEAESLFPVIRGLGLEFLKASFLYNSIENKLMVAGGDHDDLSIFVYSEISDSMYDMLSDEMEIVLYVEDNRIMPILTLCDGRDRKDLFRLKKEVENGKILFNYMAEKRNTFFYNPEKPDFAI